MGHELIYVHQENMDDLVNTWNRNRKNNNCYAFAFDHLNPGAKEKLQPGELSGLRPLEDDEYTCAALTERVLRDNPGVITSATPQCPAGYRAVALFIDNTGANRDYHFYRQTGPGSRWAHKPGSKPVTFVDDSGRVITDPRAADRDYVNDGDEMAAYNYDQFCSFYCVPGSTFFPSNAKPAETRKPASTHAAHIHRWLQLALLLVLLGAACAVWVHWPLAW